MLEANVLHPPINIVRMEKISAVVVMLAAGIDVFIHLHKIALKMSQIVNGFTTNNLAITKLFKKQVIKNQYSRKCLFDKSIFSPSFNVIHVNLKSKIFVMEKTLKAAFA